MRAMHAWMLQKLPPAGASVPITHPAYSATLAGSRRGMHGPPDTMPRSFSVCPTSIDRSNARIGRPAEPWPCHSHEPAYLPREALVLPSFPLPSFTLVPVPRVPCSLLFLPTGPEPVARADSCAQPPFPPPPRRPSLVLCDPSPFSPAFPP